jgi:hypothetical protein
MLPADAAPAAIVIDVPPSPHVVARPLTNRDGSVVGWTSIRDGNAVLIVVNNRDAGYVTIRTGRVTQIVRGSAADAGQQRAPEIVTGNPSHESAGVRAHVPQPEVIFRTP